MIRVKNRNGLQIQLKHAEDQLPYLEWKKDILIRSGLIGDREFAPTRLSEKGGRRLVAGKMSNCQDSYRWRAMVHSKFFDEIFSRTYRIVNGKKARVLDPDMFGELGWAGLAVYHQDQGSLGFIPSSSKTSSHVTPHLTWATCQEREVNLKIAKVLMEKYGIEFHSHPDHSGREILRLQAKDLNKFFSQVSKYEAPSMSTKFLKDECRTSAGPLQM